MSSTQADKIEVICPACGKVERLPRELKGARVRIFCDKCETTYSFADQNKAIAKVQDDYRLARDTEDSILII